MAQIFQEVNLFKMILVEDGQDCHGRSRSSRSKKKKHKSRNEDNHHRSANVSKKMKNPNDIKSNTPSTSQTPQNEDFDVIKKVDNVYYDP